MNAHENARTTLHSRMLIVEWLRAGQSSQRGTGWE